MAGVVADGDRERAEQTYRTNLAFAVQECRRRSTAILVEAISEAAVPGYFLSTLAKALAVADEVAPLEVWLLADTYHAAASGADFEAFIKAHADRIGHIHIADFPGRHEPGTGKIDFEPLLKRLVTGGYSRAIGFEYIPSTFTDGTLAWMPSWKEHLRA
jgi:hydroxypyruvate isomerase